jgi:hypothetical protein
VSVRAAVVRLPAAVRTAPLVELTCCRALVTVVAACLEGALGRETRVAAFLTGALTRVTVLVGVAGAGAGAAGCGAATCWVVVWTVDWTVVSTCVTVVAAVCSVV